MSDGKGVCGEQTGVCQFQHHFWSVRAPVARSNVAGVFRSGGALAVVALCVCVGVMVREVCYCRCSSVDFDFCFSSYFCVGFQDVCAAE